MSLKTNQRNAFTSPRSSSSHGLFAHSTRIYDIIAAAFVGLLLISNVSATKLIGFQIFPDNFHLPIIGNRLIFDGGFILFPLTYVIGDVLSEVYGFRRARRAIFTGFAISIIATAAFYLVQISPSEKGQEFQDAFTMVLGFVPRIVLASLCGYIAGQILNSLVLVKMKERWGENILWARLIGSTIVGEAVDTVIFCTIAFYGVVTGKDYLNYVITGYIYKVLVEVIVLPITYQVIRIVKKIEEIPVR